MSLSKCLTKINSIGYQVSSESVDSKNQGRYWHFELERDGRKYFAKINKFEDEYKKISNELRINKILVPEINTKEIEIVKIVEDIEINKKQHCLIYEFIDLLTVSSEKNQFNDFNVRDEKLNILFNRIEEVITKLSEIDYKKYDLKVESLYDDQKFEDLLNDSKVKSLENFKEISKILIEFESKVNEYCFSTGDLQMQNIFWDGEKEKMFLFDLEHAGPSPLYDDHAGIIFNLISVLDRVDLAEKLFERFVKKNDCEKFRNYFKYNFLLKSVWHIANIPEKEYLERFENGINWLLKGEIPDQVRKDKE